MPVHKSMAWANGNLAEAEVARQLGGTPKSKSTQPVGPRADGTPCKNVLYPCVPGVQRGRESGQDPARVGADVRDSVQGAGREGVQPRLQRGNGRRQQVGNSMA